MEIGNGLYIQYDWKLFCKACGRRTCCVASALKTIFAIITLTIYKWSFVMSFTRRYIRNYCVVHRHVITSNSHIYMKPNINDNTACLPLNSFQYGHYTHVLISSMTPYITSTYRRRDSYFRFSLLELIVFWCISVSPLCIKAMKN